MAVRFPLLTLAVLATACTRPIPARVIARAPAPSAAPAAPLVPAAPQPISDGEEVPPLLPPSWLPTIVEQESPGSAPALYDLVSDRIAYVYGETCAVYSMETQTYSGETTAAACRNVFFEPSDVHAPDGRVLDGARVVNPETQAAVALDCADCEIEGGAFSPDSKQVAVAVASDVLVFDTTTGKKIISYPLAKGDVAGPGRMGWGAHGLVVAAGPKAVPVMDSWPKKLKFTVHVFGATPPAKYSLPESESVALNPRGVWLFNNRSAFHDSVVDIIHVPSRSSSPLSWASYQGYYASDDVSARWLPGKHPVFEHVGSEIDPGGNRHCTRTRIFTAPGKEKLVVDKPKCSDDLPLAVADDGVTLIVDAKAKVIPGNVHPSGRFRATSARSILRVADGITLYFEEKSVRSSHGHFDTIDGGERTVFRLGSDPRNAPTFPATRLQPLLHRPNLATQFFAGDLLSPLIAEVTPPPALTMSAVKKTANDAVLTLVAGGEVKTVRTFVGGKLFKTEPLSAGATYSIKLLAVRPKPIPWKQSCDDVRAYVCNDGSCTAPVMARWCVAP